MFKKTIRTAILAAPLFFVFCGELQDHPELTDGLTIIIRDYTFTPTEISAAPGETVFFYNGGTDPHRILSESDNDAFDDTGVFDTFIITEGSFGTVTVPESALSGDEIPFYDAFFRDSMITPNGVVIVR